MIGADFTVTDHGTIFLLRPNTPAAQAWMDEHLQAEQYQMFGTAVAVEHRYIADIVEGIQADGLTTD